MKILVVTTAFPRWAADHRAPFIWEACKAVQALGNQVSVIAMHNPGSATYEEWQGIPIYRPRYLLERLEKLQKDRAGIPAALNANPLNYFMLIPFLIFTIISVVKLGRKCNLIHANWTLAALAVWAGQPLHRKPYVVTVHGSDIYRIKGHPILKQLISQVLKGAIAVIAVSQSLKNELLNLGLDPQNIFVIPDGVDTNKFHPITGDRDPFILFIGALTEGKGVRFLLHAFVEVAIQKPGSQLIFIGDGSLWDELHALTLDLGLSSCVRFLGSLSQEEVCTYLQRARLLVLPSLSEGLGVVLLEALACGTPCVGTRVGGIPDVITENVGFLVPPADVESLQQSILELLTDDVLWSRMSDSARGKALDDYSWPKIALKIHSVYKMIGDRI